VRTLAQLLNTPLHVEYVTVAQDSGLGIEGLRVSRAMRRCSH